MVTLVEQMLALPRQQAAARTDHEQTNLKRQIDRLVYDLYNLTGRRSGSWRKIDRNGSIVGDRPIQNTEESS